MITMITNVSCSQSLIILQLLRKLELQAWSKMHVVKLLMIFSISIPCEMPSD